MTAGRGRGQVGKPNKVRAEPLVQCNSGCLTPGDSIRLCSARHQVYSWRPPGKAFVVICMKKKPRSQGKFSEKAGVYDKRSRKSLWVVVNKLSITRGRTTVIFGVVASIFNNSGAGFQFHWSENLIVLDRTRR
jgi:hypothetical protein